MSTTLTNNPAKAGQRATKLECFGEFSRYGVFAVHTRFDAVEWMVQDAEVKDDLGMPSIIRQASTRDQALAGLA